MGFQDFVKRRNRKKYNAYTALLSEILIEVADEDKKIKDGKPSVWNTIQLNNVIAAEIKELLQYANKGELYFKYGKKQRMLESTYLVLDSCDNLDTTQLGKKLIELQAVYSNL